MRTRRGFGRTSSSGLDAAPVSGMVDPSPRRGIRQFAARLGHIQRGDRDFDLADLDRGGPEFLAVERRTVAALSGGRVAGQKRLSGRRPGLRKGAHGAIGHRLVGHLFLRCIVVEYATRVAAGRQSPMTARSWPFATWSPAATRTSVTVPSAGAATTCSIFIASRVTSGSPASTSIPAPT